MIYDDRARLDLQGVQYLIVGTGFFGATMAERIAADKNKKVVVIERRNHIGGNSYSEIEPQTGIEWHRYGSHIFHTGQPEVWHYINRFGSFNSYRHRVFSCYQGKLYPLPINLATINSFYSLNLGPQDARHFIISEAEKENTRLQDNLEGRALSIIGRSLYQAFIKGYTAKQWGIDPKQLPAEIIDRLPVRYNYDSDYFNDPWQGIPMDGYGQLIRKMLGHENIDVYLGVDYFDMRREVPKNCLVIFTGSVDKFFDYRFGRLKWRSLRFERQILPIADYQGTSVINYSEENIAFTRIHEFRHFHKERNYPSDRTIICKEYPMHSFDDGEPLYPVNTQEDRTVHRLYVRELRSMPNVIVGGRLGSYSYINMDQAILSALQTYEESVRNRNE